MKLHFDLTQVKRLIAHARAAKEHRILYEDPNTNQPGLWIVGDDGIYLMSNGRPALLVDPKHSASKNVVCYARECDPSTMEFDAWWAIKNTAWGGDDGIEFFTVEAFEQALRTYKPNERLLVMNATPSSVGIYAWRSTGPKGKRKA